MRTNPLERILKLYDFSAYAERRDAIRKERAAAEAVVEAVAHLQEPGSVHELKQRVNGWFSLHKEAIQRVANLS